MDMDENINLSKFKSRKLYLVILLCQTVGSSTTTLLPSTAVRDGAVGCLIVYVISFLILGIPLLYMEYIISQFTSRDCLDIWRVRPFLSHIGYFLVAWQVVILLFSHVISSFALYFTLISFETPIPFYTCGDWTNKDCNIMASNYTVAQECTKDYDQYEYCTKIHETFPETQFWRFNLLQELTNARVKIEWKICLPSGLACVLLYLSTFKRQRSIKFFAWFLFIFPTGAYLVLFIGSLMQKGVVMKFSEAIDVDFSFFFENMRINHYILQIIYMLAIGSGISFNLAYSSGFRAPNYANTVISVVICAGFTILSTCTTAMIFCPYAYEYSIETEREASRVQSFLFEKVPRLINYYDNKTYWLIIIFSSNAFLEMRTTTVLFYNIQELLADRYIMAAKYPGICSFVMSVILFLVSLPFLGPLGMRSLAYMFSHVLHLVSLFMTIVEILVFVLWYGVDRFCEDVHFMQGVQPGNFMKLMWIISAVLLSYVFIIELSMRLKLDSMGSIVGTCILALMLGGIILIAVLRLAWATIQNQLKKAVSLDRRWGPQSDVLQRSRAMFTGQAMTKEYLYRQYHLQAGIIARQKIANVKAEIELNRKDLQIDEDDEFVSL